MDDKQLIDDLIDRVIDLRLGLIGASIPDGHCPYAYYYVEDSHECDNCTECKARFFETMRERITEEERRRYDA